jgi:hypothetical protein
MTKDGHARLSIRISPELHARLEHVSLGEGEWMAETARRALTIGLTMIEVDRRRRETARYPVEEGVDDGPYEDRGMA